jgi:hypothetical protein
MSRISFSIDEVKYLCDLLQPEVGKDAGALQLIRRFEKYARDSDPTTFTEWQRDWWNAMFPESPR